jgi:Uma2 family endonuclease
VIASSRPRLSFEEYCQIEAESTIRHEYEAGQAWAMAGGSREHAAIAANVVTLLSVALRGHPCQVHSSDLRIRVSATGLATHPDVTVICGRAELDPEDRLGHTVLNPLVVVEILSSSTEKYDRTEKLSHYKRIEASREIVLVGHGAPQVDVWRRAEDASWVEVSYRGEGFELVSLGVALPIADVYRDPLT